MLNAIKNFFKLYFIAGLLVLGPLVISVWLVKFIVQSTDEALLTSQWLPFPIPGLGVVAAMAIILIAGFLGRNVLGRWIFAGTGEVFAHIPVIGTIYSSSKQVFESLLGDHHKNFGRVVLIQYPHPGTYTLAFVTSENVPTKVQKLVAEKLISVYVPTTPNPTSGFYLYVPQAQAKPTDMRVEEAFKVIVSLGMVKQKGQEATVI